MSFTEQEIEGLKSIHEKIRRVLIDNGNNEYGDVIIDGICEVIGIPTTTVYYEEEVGIIESLGLSENQVKKIVLEWYTNGMCSEDFLNDDGLDLEEYLEKQTK